MCLLLTLITFSDDVDRQDPSDLRALPDSVSLFPVFSVSPILSKEKMIEKFFRVRSKTFLYCIKDQIIVWSLVDHVLIQPGCPFILLPCINSSTAITW